MDQESAIQPKNTIKRIAIVAVIMTALVIIAASVFSIINPNGVETAADGAENVISLTASGVNPSELRIAKGDAVMWVNESDTARKLIITSSNPQQEVEGFGGDEAILKDEVYSFIFDNVGTFTYEDTTNPDTIKGTIIVE
jgi:plastocyanin